MSNNGRPLATGDHDDVKYFRRSSQYPQQFACMQQQLARAHVEHHDLMCKQVLARVDTHGAMQLTLSDFEESSVDEMSCPCKSSERRSSYNAIRWSVMATSCFL